MMTFAFRQTVAATGLLAMAMLAMPEARAQALLPLTLQAAVQTALAQNVAYEESASRVASVEAALRETAARNGLNISARESSQYVDPVARLSTPFGALPFSPSNFTFTPELVARYVAYDGGVSAARIGAAETRLAQSRESLHRARQKTTQAVADAYYALAAALALERVASHATAVAARHVNDARERLRAGMAPRADLLRAQTDFADRQVAQIDAANATAVGQATLDRIMGVPQDELHLPSSPLNGAVPSMNVNELIRESSMQRPDLAAARDAVNIAAEAVAEARATRRPQVTITASDGNVQPAVETGFHNQFSVGLNAVWTLFDSGFSRAALEQAQAGVSSATLDVANLQSEIELQVREAYLNVQAGRAKTDAARRLVTFADENLRLALLRYRGGVGTTLEVQDAAQADRDAQRALVQSQAQTQSALVDLQVDVGTL